jgi:hypothetical protein
MKLLNEDQLLDKSFRVKVIKDIKSNWNTARKIEHKKRHEVYKDNTVKYVMEKLKRELNGKDTLQLMENRASNISITKKIINKLGRVYSGGGVQRETGNTTSDIQIQELSKLMNWNQKLKKSDRFARLFKNCLAWVYPDFVSEGQWRLALKVFSPWQYDVLENPNEPEEASAIILSDFIDRQSLAVDFQGSGPQVTELESVRGRTGDTVIAATSNAVATDDCQTYIWWSNKYHFTTDEKGEIIGKGTITPPDLLNPIGSLPGVTVAEDQDGNYWAEGGGDLVDGSILINTMITDMNAIAFMQGWGQMVITGTTLPQEFRVGPHHALVLTYDVNKGEAKPDVAMVSANPPLGEWRSSIEQYVALLLSTNNLSPTTIASKLDVANFPSGIAMLIDRSESTDSIQDKQTEFYWVEMKLWEVVKRWHNLYESKGLLIKEFSDIGKLPDQLRVTVKFPDDTAEVISQADQLNNMKIKKDLGIVSQIDLLMQDNPGMTKEEAQAKLQEIQAHAAQVSGGGEVDNSEEISQADNAINNEQPTTG